MAKAQGVSPYTVQRICSAHGLKPHLVKTFKLSNDPRFEEKLTDVVGLYLNPPEKAMCPAPTRRARSRLPIGPSPASPSNAGVPGP